MIFNFRLQKVLSVRKIEEDLAAKRHAEAKECLYQAEQELEQLSCSLNSTMDAFDELKIKDELTSEALHLHSLHVAGLKNRIVLTQKELDSAQKHVEKTNQELVEAHRSVEALERLREKEKAAWLDRENKRQAKEVDELILCRRANNSPRQEENNGS